MNDYQFPKAVLSSGIIQSLYPSQVRQELLDRNIQLRLQKTNKTATKVSKVTYRETLGFLVELSPPTEVILPLDRRRCKLY